MAHSYITTQPKPVDWLLLSSFNTDGEHIRIHKLREGDDLKAAIKSYQSTHARAVIIINNEDSQTLSEESSALLECFDNYLIIVLSSKEGLSLLRSLTMIMRYMQSMEYESLILESSCFFMQNKLLL